MITKELSEFDFLPNAASVDVNTVAALFGCKVPTIWLRLRRKEIIAPRKYGSHTRWNVGEIRDALKGDKTYHLTTELSKEKGSKKKPNTSRQVDPAASSAMYTQGKVCRDTLNSNQKKPRGAGR